MDKMYLLAASLRYGPPDTTLQVPNLLSPSWDTTDEGRRVAWHGTTESGTLGIVTNGYKNGFGKGNDDRSNGYGLATPGTFVATEESMGRGYSCYSARRVKSSGLAPLGPGGEPSAQDGTLPTSTLMKVIAPQAERLWTDKCGQELYQSNHVHTTRMELTLHWPHCIHELYAS